MISSEIAALAQALGDELGADPDTLIGMANRLASELKKAGFALAPVPVPE